MTSIPRLEIKELKMHRDERGVFTEIFREEWFPHIHPNQWNVVSTKKGVLRGVHVHLKHWDHLTIIQGKAVIGVCDLRKNSPAFGTSQMIPVEGEKMSSIVIPPGVAHGFYFLQDSTHVYSVTEYWNEADELGCHFLDPDLHLDWPNKNPIISQRDQDLPRVKDILDLQPSFNL